MIVALFALRVVGNALARHRAARARAEAELEAVLDAQAEVEIEELQALTPVGEGPTAGSLRRGWRARRQGRGLRQSRTIYNVEPYLGRVVEGRGAIDARPSGHPLHFFLGGRELIRWRVGPAAPNPFPTAAHQIAHRRFAAELPKVHGAVRLGSGPRF